MVEVPGDNTQVQGSASIVAGASFDTTAAYEAQAVLNKGSDAEIRGNKELIPVVSNLVVFDKKNPCNRIPNKVKPQANNTFLLAADTNDVAYPVIKVDINPSGTPVDNILWRYRSPLGSPIAGTLTGPETETPIPGALFGKQNKGDRLV